MRSISHRLVIDYTPQTLSSNIFSQSISDVKIYVVFDDNKAKKELNLHVENQCIWATTKTEREIKYIKYYNYSL